MLALSLFTVIPSLWRSVFWRLSASPGCWRDKNRGTIGWMPAWYAWRLVWLAAVWGLCWAIGIISRVNRRRGCAFGRRLQLFGALLAALVGLWLWGVWRKRPFASYTDLLTPGFALLAVFTWAACWLAGCAYGQETTFGLLAANLPDDFGLFAVRYQTQLLGLLWSLLIFIAVILTSQRWREGQLLANAGQPQPGLRRHQPAARRCGAYDWRHATGRSL
ncbi:MAG: prolipoprotein diacylglyceryl transferase [Chloroflexi bacterium]|nr:prolipoprotein diacylglyceryl transferase [Chloroflexota bacterium]